VFGNKVDTIVLIVRGGSATRSHPTPR
jgi:hypothetical protein